MKLAALHSLLSRLSLAAPPLAQSEPNLLGEMGLGAAVLITMTGLVLRWYIPQHRMSVEERVKDGKMTEDEARRQMKFYARCAPVLTLLGMALLIVALIDMVV